MNCIATLSLISLRATDAILDANSCNPPYTNGRHGSKLDLDLESNSNLFSGLNIQSFNHHKNRTKVICLINKLNVFIFFQISVKSRNGLGFRKSGFRVPEVTYAKNGKIVQKIIMCISGSAITSKQRLYLMTKFIVLFLSGDFNDYVRRTLSKVSFVSTSKYSSSALKILKFCPSS